MRRLVPVLARLLHAHPGLQLDLRLDDAQVDLIRDGIDLAVRIGPLQDSTLVARRIDWQSMLLCASPRHVAAHGLPRRLEDLRHHPAVVFRMPSSGRVRPWQFRSDDGETVELEPASRVRVDDGQGIVAALCADLGLCQLPGYMVADEIADGRLVELLPERRPPPLPISVIHPSGRLLPARVRVALETLVAMAPGVPAG
jgi:DNA-binding transcriptional LysR family regulator